MPRSPSVCSSRGAPSTTTSPRSCGSWKRARAARRSRPPVARAPRRPVGRRRAALPAARGRGSRCGAGQRPSSDARGSPAAERRASSPRWNRPVTEAAAGPAAGAGAGEPGAGKTGPRAGARARRPRGRARRSGGRATTLAPPQPLGPFRDIATETERRSGRPPSRSTRSSTPRATGARGRGSRPGRVDDRRDRGRPPGGRRRDVDVDPPRRPPHRDGPRRDRLELSGGGAWTLADPLRLMLGRARVRPSPFAGCPSRAARPERCAASREASPARARTSAHRDDRRRTACPRANRGARFGGDPRDASRRRSRASGAPLARRGTCSTPLRSRRRAPRRGDRGALRRDRREARRVRRVGRARTSADGKTSFGASSRDCRSRSRSRPHARDRLRRGALAALLARRSGETGSGATRASRGREPENERPCSSSRLAADHASSVGAHRGAARPAGPWAPKRSVARRAI